MHLRASNLLLLMLSAAVASYYLCCCRSQVRGQKNLGTLRETADYTAATGLVLAESQLAMAPDRSRPTIKTQCTHVHESCRNNDSLLGFGI